MKAKFKFTAGYYLQFFTSLKEAKTFAENNEIYEVGIIKNGVYKDLYRLNPMSERYERVMKVNEAKAAINKFLTSNN